MTALSEPTETTETADAATRASYDTVATTYEQLLRAELDARPWNAPCSPPSPNSSGDRSRAPSPTSAAAPDGSRPTSPTSE